MKVDGAALIAIITAVGTIAVGAIAGFVNYIVRRQSRAVDSATVRKTEAETVAREVQTARELLAEVRAYFTERIDKLSADHREEITELTTQMRILQERIGVVEAQTNAMRSSFRVHRSWDDTAYAVLRLSDPNYPPPPTIEGL